MPSSPPAGPARRRAAARLAAACRAPALLASALLASALLAPAPAAAQPAAAAAAGRAAGRAITFADFAAVRAVSDPQLSPDGRQVLYAVRTADVEANRRTTRTLVVPVAGGTPRAWPDDTTRAAEARWSPDGRRVAYVSGGQLWLADADGGNRRQLTRLNGGAAGPVWSPAGDLVVFASAVWPACTGTSLPNGFDDRCNAQKDSARAASKVQAHVADRLLYRHWNAWDEGTRQHLFAVTVGADAPAVRDLVPGAAYDVPPGPFGGSEGYAVSPDGREVAFTAKLPTRDEAWVTNVDVWTVPAAGGAAPALVTRGMPGADQNPAYSPDGRAIVFASQRRAGFESDRWRLMRYDRATRRVTEILPAWDRNADAYAFPAGDARALFVQTVDAGRDKLYRVALTADGAAVSAPALVAGTHNNAALTTSRDGRTLAWTRDATQAPAEVYVAALDGTAPPAPRRLTRENDALVGRLALHGAEEFWFAGAGGTRVQGFVVKPPQWEPGKKYPALLVIHGGPQGAFLDQWHSRWNYQMLAAPGMGVVVVNPRGSTGYGQRFVDEVSRDWGGRAYEDLMKGLDAAIARHPWIDASRVGATGGSYGGYMTNWIATHAPQRFRAFATHAGVWNLENMYGATEEVWFPDWEYGGPYWVPELMRTQYRRWSPHLFAANLKVPHLVLHGELDYRVPYYEGVSLFTALQKLGVPSRLVVFPDEGHWVGKPQNQRLWWDQMQGWFARYLRAEGAAQSAAR
jgi:dipeptidyl aminopeptidase/acylaminoacyl peptidase